MTKITTYIRESIAEMRKVSWPTKKQLQNYTALVILMSVSMVLFFGIVDYGLSQVLAVLLTKG